ncbi:acyl-CoA dehydrogenase family protein [Nocardiopsis sp. CNT312]|uniref:acyl-CoA dehydrogenase family protein n=1 Tax=Nocardiopsis sp. CNT312 TaxID=1137268 RepID=UPI000684AD91|nr:acyl-CoA dehydrogenase family protein [Nocardiopsis sp. CNT312]
MRSPAPAAEAVTDRPWFVEARQGSPDEAWRALSEGLPEAPVLGPSGHGLTCGSVSGAAGPAAEPVAGISVAGRSWSLLARPATAERAPDPPPGWSAGVAAIRLGLSLWLRDRAVARLRKRKAGGRALVHQQLVGSDLAWAATEQAIAESLLTGSTERPDDHAVLCRASRRVTAADRCVLRLFGASGFLSDGPGQVAYLSELMADAYLEPVAGDGGCEGGTR